jgi:hypothetical protein
MNVSKTYARLQHPLDRNRPPDQCRRHSRRQLGTSHRPKSTFGAWTTSAAPPAAPFPQWRERDLPGFWATLAYLPRSSTPTDRQHHAITVQRYCLIIAFRTLDNVGSALDLTNEARSRGLHAPCVRFAAGITRHTPRNTRFPLVANLCRVRIVSGFSWRNKRKAFETLLDQDTSSMCSGSLRS